MAKNISDKDTFISELQAVRDQVPGLPYNPYRALSAYGDGMQTNQMLKEAASKDIAGISASLGRPVTSENYDKEAMKITAQNQALTSLMGKSRNPRGSSRTGSARKSSQDERWFQGFNPKTSMLGGGGSAMGGDVYNAIPRFYDPLEYWDLSGLPWNVADEGHRHKLHKWLRLYYATHYLVPILIDIFTRFPLVGMHLESSDPALTAIYEDLFLNQLKYEDFLVALGREFWLVGEAFPLGSFDEDLGVWEHEELINPEDVVIDNFPLLDSKQLKIVPPDYLRRIAQTKSPAREWYMLQQNYSDLIPYLLKGEHIPISPVMLTQVGNKLNDWDDHGTPILLRGLRTLLHEEKLLASQDAIAERLYSPFLLAKLGIMDMGDGLPPWIPGPDELNAVRDDIDIAMASDFRVMVHHFGIDMSSVFGREQMPRLGDDFDRIERRLMEVFGVNPSLLSAGSNSQPYASSALQAEFMNQMLRTFQKVLKDHFKFRASVVAEAQGHYAYERKGQSRIPIYENVVSYDDDGNKLITKEHKLLVPDLKMECLAYGSRVSTPNGPVATETLEVGDDVWGWDVANDRATLAKVTHSYDNGLQTTYGVYTKSGRNIRTTAEHPFLTQRGWVEASDLCEEDKIRVGTQLPIFNQTISERDARLDPSWDEINDIQLHQAEPTWSLGISGDHTHITEGLVTHNTFDLRDEATERQFLMGLRSAGLPIPDDKLMIGVTWKGDDYINEYNRDIMKKTIAQQRAKMDTYTALVIQGLPVPMDLKYEVESVLQGGTGPAMGDPGAGGGDMGGAGGAGMGGPPPGGGPESDFGSQMPAPPSGLGPGPGTAPPGGGAPPMAPGGPAGGGTNAPQISNERRPGLTYNTASVNDIYSPIPQENWPKEMQDRAIVIKESIDKYGWFYEEPEDEEPKLSAILNNEDPDDPETWILKANQKIAKHNGENIIIESHKKRLNLPIEAHKKYSLIDPLSETLENLDESTKPESAG
jgi:hypothetical protein